MAITLGGSSGIVFPDATTIPASSVTSFLSPGITDTDNALTLQTGTEINGSTGVRVNNTLITTANSFIPSNTVAPAITGTAKDTQVLTVSTGTWTNTPTSYAYQWKRNGTTNIGTNANTYTCVTADIGYTIKCTVTATNAIGNTSADSNNTATVAANSYTASYLVIAGAGGAGGNMGGGGGAGGLLTSTVSLSPGTVYTATVGAGGAGGVGFAISNPSNGSNSVLSGTGLTTITSIGGGHGASQTGGGVGNSGGSGGGSTYTVGYGGAGTSGQGYAGGGAWNDPNYPSGGGGGSGGVGQTPANGSSNGGNGGTGTSSSITGTAVSYAAGGGGGTNGSGGGGSGGGSGAGNAGSGQNTGGGSGAANTGSGGGGGSGNSNPNYGATGGGGGSGVIILSVPTSNYSGTKTGSPTITTSGSNTIIKFTSSGTYTA